MNPSLFVFEASPVPIPLIFTLNFLIVIVSLLYIYGRLTLGDEVDRSPIDYLAAYFFLTLGFPFGAVVGKVAETQSTPSVSLWVFIFAGSVFSFILSVLLRNAARRILSTVPLE